MHSLHRIGTLVLFLMAFSTAVFAAWDGETTTTDGVTLVLNPETGALGEYRQEMRELWRRGGEDDEEVFFGTIAECLNDSDGNIYLLDGQLSEIHVFDPDGELLRTIGRQGEGPGEFQNGADMFWAPNGQIGVVQAWPGKIVMITPDGDPGMTFGLPYRNGGGWSVRNDGDRVFILGRLIGRTAGVREHVAASGRQPALIWLTGTIEYMCGISHVSQAPCTTHSSSRILSQYPTCRLCTCACCPAISRVSSLSCGTTGNSA